MIRKALTALTAAAVIAVPSIAAAESATAATGTCLATTLSGSELDMCRTAVQFSTVSFVPLNGRGVVNLGREWCVNKGRYGVATANTLMERKVGHAKMIGIFTGAEGSFC